MAVAKLVRLIGEKKLGRIMRALRDHESKVMFTGYSPLRYKLFVWTFSAVLAGIGNVYRSEVLFRLRVDPFRPGREIRRAFVPRRVTRARPAPKPKPRPAPAPSALHGVEDVFALDFIPGHSFLGFDRQLPLCEFTGTLYREPFPHGHGTGARQQAR